MENPFALIVLFISLGNTAEPADRFKSECELSIPYIMHVTLHPMYFVLSNRMPGWIVEEVELIFAGTREGLIIIKS